MNQKVHLPQHLGGFAILFDLRKLCPDLGQVDNSGTGKSEENCESRERERV